MTTPVSFELSKLLKDKGLRYYSQNNYFYNGDGEIKYGKVLNTYNDYPAEMDECDAPYIAEVVMWLYEKHGIWISVEPPSPKRIVLWEYYIQKAKDRSLLGQNSGYSSPTEAYEAAIEHVLNNLI